MAFWQTVVRVHLCADENLFASLLALYFKNSAPRKFQTVLIWKPIFCILTSCISVSGEIASVKFISGLPLQALWTFVFVKYAMVSHIPI